MKELAILFCVGFTLFTFQSCKDDEETEPVWDPSGLYNVEVQVSKRIPIFGDSINGPYNFMHQIFYDQAMDTSLRKCCEWQFGGNPCDNSYTISNMRIFKHNGSYHLYGAGGTVTVNGQKRTFHLPLEILKNDIFTNDSIYTTKRVYQFSRRDNMQSSSGAYPALMQFFKFNLTKSEGGMKGSWFFKDVTTHCLINTGLPDWVQYNTGEFADITFTRIGD